MKKLRQSGLVVLCLCVGLQAMVPTVSAQRMTERQRISVVRRLTQSTVSVLAGPSSGSGFIVGRERWVITNAHVVEPAAGAPIRIRFGSGTILPARVIELDANHDLCLLEVTGRVPSEPLNLANSDSVEVGQQVLAYGSPFGLDGTLTEGIISARRDVPGVGGSGARRLIQTDAPINPGNSGGPLVDRRGRVVGVNTAILSRTGGSHGIGFAVPSNYVTELLDRVRTARRGSSAQTGRVDLGIVAEDWVDPVRQGVRIVSTRPNSPAQRAGLIGSAEAPPPAILQMGLPWNGHIITAVNGQPVRSVAELTAALRPFRPGQSVRLSITAGGQTGNSEVAVLLSAPQ